jgi:hypothetical protein
VIESSIWQFVHTDSRSIVQCMHLHLAARGQRIEHTGYTGGHQEGVMRRATHLLHSWRASCDTHYELDTRCAAD